RCSNMRANLIALRLGEPRACDLGGNQLDERKAVKSVLLRLDADENGAARALRQAADGVIRAVREAIGLHGHPCRSASSSLSGPALDFHQRVIAPCRAHNVKGTLTRIRVPC